MRLAWQVLKQVIEPSSAIALAAVLAQPERVRGRRVGIILSGGNVDPDALPTLLGGSMPRASRREPRGTSPP